MSKDMNMVQRLRILRHGLLQADGDRDLGFQSNITTTASMAIADELKDAADLIEQLEAEVGRLKRVKLAHDAMEKWCGELTKKAEAAEAEVERLKGYLNEEERACVKAIITATKAEAQASRMRDALKAFIKHFGPLSDNPMLNDGARNCFNLARKALEQ